MFPGDGDIERAVAELAAELPEPLRALARVACDYRWSWAEDGPAILAAIDSGLWAHCGGNPRRLLTEVPRSTLRHAAADATRVARAARLAQTLRADRERPWHVGAATPEQPVAFCCAEFGVHGSLPIYSGGLGILAGDILKEASDLALPMVGVGLMCRTGYCHQRIDVTGLQHEYWLDADSGRVPLYLLDTDRLENSQVGRWVSSRLYESNRAIRLAQYAVLGVGGQRALQAMGITPLVLHLNEGHPALAVFELLARQRALQPGVGDDEAWQRVRKQLVFTTHTPVAAGSETYARDELLAMLGRLADASGDRERFLALGRIDPAQPQQPSGLTALALRLQPPGQCRRQSHGQVARSMWQPLFPGRASEGVPINHVTNGVHLPTCLQGPMRVLQA